MNSHFAHWESPGCQDLQVFTLRQFGFPRRVPSHMPGGSISWVTGILEQEGSRRGSLSVQEADFTRLPVFPASCISSFSRHTNPKLRVVRSGFPRLCSLCLAVGNASVCSQRGWNLEDNSSLGFQIPPCFHYQMPSILSPPGISRTKHCLQSVCPQPVSVLTTALVPVFLYSIEGLQMSIISWGNGSAFLFLILLVWGDFQEK